MEKKITTIYTFEDFLQDEHAKDFCGTGDMLPECYKDWLQELEIDNFIEYAEQYTNKCIKRVLEKNKIIKSEYNIKDILNSDKLVYLDKHNFPVEEYLNKPFISFFRRLFLTKRIMKYKTWLKKRGCRINFK